MRFALIGDEPVGLAVARAVASDRAHQLVRLVGRPQTRPEIPGLAPGGSYCRHWEELLADAGVDAVIVAGANEEMQQSVRQLVQAGKSVLLPPALLQPAAFFYEMALIEAESPGRLFPLLGLRGHPLIATLCDLLVEDGLGRIRHVQFDRRMAATASASNPLLTETDLARALLGDADLLRTLCGPYDQVTASRSGDAECGYSLATVTLAGSGVPQAVWTAAATGGEPDWRLTLAGDAGTALLEGDPDRAAFRLTLTRRGLTDATEGCVDDGGRWLLDAFAASLAPATRSSHGTAEPEPRPDRNRRDVVAGPSPAPSNSLWGELARAVELVEAVERSVRRRRTIDVHFETPSERGIFKTQMTAVGCSLLVLTLGAVVIYLTAAAMIDLPPFLKRILVALIFVPLGVFLVMQLLFFVARPAARDGH